ncbi:uncharacterized protein [Branchiostoma lanceolatum]|uniref:uncharacterized protein isoform X2 n=1 Tax=Branchiostoma lanceolatum TaxID=7740 RepID=UPI003455100A
MGRCVVCKSSTAQMKGITFHSFPRDTGRRQQWLANIRNHFDNIVSDETSESPDDIWTQDDEIIDTWKVCSRHFEESCFADSLMKRRLNMTSKTFLSLDAVPTLFMEDELSKPVTKLYVEQNLRPLKPKEPGQEHSGEKPSADTEDVPVNQATSYTHDWSQGRPSFRQFKAINLKQIGKRKRSEDTADLPAESLTPVYLSSQQNRWKGACNTLELTDDQMAKFLLDRYYKGDKSVSAFTGSQITHKTLLLDRGLLTLWNDTMAAKGFGSDKDFLWFLLLRPQKSGTNSKVYTVRDDVASDECVPVKVDYVGPGCATSDTSQDLNDAANLPLVLQPPVPKPSLTQKKSVTETVMTTPIPVTYQNSFYADIEVKSKRAPRHNYTRGINQLLGITKEDPESSDKDSRSCDKSNGVQTPRRNYKRSIKMLELTKVDQVYPLSSVNDSSSCDNVVQMPRYNYKRSIEQMQERTKDDQVFPESSVNDSSSCDNVVQMPRHNYKRTRRQMQELTKDDQVFPESSARDSSSCETRQKVLKVGGTEKTSISCTSSQIRDRLRKRSDTHSPKSAKSRKQDHHVSGPREEPVKNLGNCENTTSSCGEVGIDMEEHEQEIDLDHTVTSSHLSSDTLHIRVKQKDGVEKNIASDDNHIPSTWGTVSIKVEKEDGLENDFGNFDSTNSSFPQLALNIKEEDKVLYSSCDNTRPSQLSRDTVRIKVEKEDGLEMDLGSHDNTNTSSHLSLDSGDIQEEELEMHLNMAIMATAEHLD